MSLALRRFSLFSILALLPACETFSGVAPKDTPRVEIELAVVVNEAFVATLTDVDAESTLITAVKEAVREKADYGLRFYATPSEMYGAKDKRPPYLMTVELTSLDIVFAEKTVEEEVPAPSGAESETAGADADAETEADGAAAGDADEAGDETQETPEKTTVTKTHVETRVDKVAATVRASIQRRRDNAPPLIVANQSASSQVSASTAANDDDATSYAPRYDGEAVEVPNVLEEDIVRAVEAAANKALKGMRTAIDREFAPEVAPDTGEVGEDGA